MATIWLTGIFRSDTTLDGIGAFSPGNTFSTDSMTVIEVDLGADSTVLAGDEDPTNETPNDPTQTYDDGSGPKAFAYDFTIWMYGSNGVWYEVVVFDYDVNGDGDFGDGFLAGSLPGQDPDENNYFMAFKDVVPPPGITLTTQDGLNETWPYTDNSPYLPLSQVVQCFGSGTMIETVDGPIAVENLEKGMMVLTEDNGAQPIRWVGSKKLDAIDLIVNPKLRPILIRAGALGKDYPAKDLIVSRQHRVLVRSEIAQSMFGTDEVLIPAIKLVAIDGIEVVQVNPNGVEYFHFLFDSHEIVRSNGALTESLFTGPEALKSVTAEARKEIETIFPEICEPDFTPVAARYIPAKGKLMKDFAERLNQAGIAGR